MNKYRQEAILKIFLEITIPAVMLGLIVFVWQVIDFLLKGRWQSISIDWMIVNYIPFEWYVVPKDWLGLNMILRGAMSFHPMISMLFINLFFLSIIFISIFFFHGLMRKIREFFREWHW